MITYKMSHFQYNSDTQTFVAEASSLSLPVGKFPETFDIVSDKTGKRVTFHFVKNVLDAEGDLMYNLYAGQLIGEGKAKVWPEGSFEASKFQTIIFND